MILNKFAAGLVATAIGVTAISAPAKADEDFNALLAIVAGGLIINEIVKNDDKEKNAAANYTNGYEHRHSNGNWHTHKYKKRERHYHKKPDRVIKLPTPRKLHTLPMPDECRRTFRSQHGLFNRGFSKSCIQKRGYRVSKRGVVTHHKYPHQTRVPNLVR